MANVLFDSRFADNFASVSPVSFVSNAGDAGTGTVGANANRGLLILVGFENTQAIMGTVSVTWNGVSGTQLIAVDCGGTLAGSTYLFGIKGDANIATGDQTLACSWTGGGFANGGLGAISLYNVDQTTAFQNASSNTGNSTTGTGTATSATGNMVVCGIVDDNANGAGYALSGGTSDWRCGAGDGNYGGGHIDGAASVGLTYTIGNAAKDWGLVWVDVIAAGGGGVTGMYWVRA